MSIIDSLLNYIGQYNTGMQTLSNSAYNNLLGMINQAGSQNTFNRHDAPSVSGRETRLSNQQASQNNLALLNALIGSGYGQVSGGMGNISSILPYLLLADPQYAGQLRTNAYEDWKMDQYKKQVETGGQYVGGNAIIRGFSPGSTGAIMGSPWFTQADKADKYTFSNAMDMGLAYGNQANSLKNPKTVKQADSTQAANNSIYGEVGNPYNYMNLINQGYNMSGYKPKTTKKKSNTGLMNYA